MNRLKRIEGQVRGVQRMLEHDAYCTDILVQVSAINAALNSFNKVLLANHVRTCVADNIRKGNDDVIDELVWMADMKPVRILIMSAFIAILNRGAGNLQTVYLIPSSFANIMIGIILLFMLGCEFFIKYKVSFSFMSGRKSSAINDKGGRYDY